MRAAIFKISVFCIQTQPDSNFSPYVTQKCSGSLWQICGLWQRPKKVQECLGLVETGQQGNLPDFFNHHYLMVENLQHHDSLSPLPGQKAKTQIRCDRQIAARCGCFGKQDRLCLSDEKCSGGRQTGLWDSEGRDRERARRGRRRTVQNENETAKCWTV